VGLRYLRHINYYEIRLIIVDIFIIASKFPYLPALI